MAKRDRKEGRPGLAPDVSERVRQDIDKLLLMTPYAGRGGITRLAQAIGISQPALTQIRKGGGVSLDTASAVARLVGADPRSLLGGTSLGVMVTGRYPNLEVCLAYHRGRWSEPTVAAVRAGLFPDDVSPDAWRARLDVLESSHAAIVAGATGSFGSAREQRNS